MFPIPERFVVNVKVFKLFWLEAVFYLNVVWAAFLLKIIWADYVLNFTCAVFYLTLAFHLCFVSSTLYLRMGQMEGERSGSLRHLWVTWLQCALSGFVLFFSCLLSPPSAQTQNYSQQETRCGSETSDKLLLFLLNSSMMESTSQKHKLPKMHCNWMQFPFKTIMFDFQILWAGRNFITFSC